MEGDRDVRQSQRLLGNAPEIFSTPLLRVRDGARRRLEVASEVVKKAENGTDFNVAGPVMRSAKKTSIAGSVRSSASEAAKLKVQAEIESIQRLGKLEDELANRKYEREKLIEEKRLEIKKLQIDEDVDAGVENDATENILIEDKCEPNPQTKVKEWIDNQPHQDSQNEWNQPESDPMAAMNSRLEKLLTRQSIPRDLPIFNGEPEEWPLFYQQYERTTKLCGLSNEENIVRLQKCLRGKARDAVLPILGIPNNVGRVMETLEMLFGRSDQIIRCMMSKVRNAIAPTRSKPETIIAFSNMVSNLVATMKSLNKLGHIYNPELLDTLVLKMSVEQQFQWCQIVQDLEDDPTLEDFDWWLNRVAMTASLMPVQLGNEKPTKQQEKKNEKKAIFVAAEKGDKKCFHCSDPSHKLEKCEAFANAEIQERWKTVKNNRVCYCCLSPGHRSNDCKFKKVCGVDECGRIHHQLLHKAESKPESPPDEDKDEWCGHVKPSGKKSEVLLRVIPVRLSGPKGTMKTFALLDEGSTLTLVDSCVTDALGVDGPVQPLCLQWTGEHTQEICDSRLVSIDVAGCHDGAKQFSLGNARTVRGLALPSQTVDMRRLKKSWPYLNDVPFDSLVRAKPLILIGSDNILLTTPRKVRQGHWGDPIATKTWLGWVVHGNLPREGDSGDNLSFHVCKHEPKDDDLNKLIKDSFSTESFGVRVVEEKARSKEDERAVQILEKTTRRIGAKFETGLLWKTDGVTLPESRSNALRRLHCMERKMDRDPVFADAYCAKVDEYIQKGYCRRLSDEEKRRRGPRTYYIPHFAVYNVHKAKLRFVFDAAAKSHGVSLNDNLLKGPDFLNSLQAVLMRFRRHVVGIAGDVREMFHQIRIIEDDIDSQRFLWRGKDREKEPDELVMLVMIFGAACSPCSAQYVKDVNAREFRNDFPETAESAIRNTYMDDNLHGAKSDTDAATRISEAIELFRRGGFQICNWACSSRVAIQAVPAELRSKNLINLEDKESLPFERILGMRWDPEEDIFTFEVKFPKVHEEVLTGQKVPTKREMASLVSSVYDPLGLVTHFTIKARILFQEVWLSKTDWDEEIPEELVKVWKWWVKRLAEIVSVKVPRCYSPNLGEADSVQLHVFVDASGRAFATAAYLVVTCSGVVTTAFVASRARVAPLKALSIPRLELQAAVMGTRLVITIRREIEVPIGEVFYWSDSRTVISWIRSDSRRFKQFVAHRLGEIHESTEVTQWRWVPTKENVADEATRTNVSADFHPNSRWYQGPSFLRLPEDCWPKEKPAELGLEDVELRKDNVFLATYSEADACLPEATRFSSWLKMMRATAWVLRFSGNLRCEERVVGELNGQEIREAQVRWWKVVQESHFAEETKSLRKGQPVPANSKLVSLSPFLDDAGLLRVKGRLGNGHEMEYDMRHPVILHPKHRFTQLLIHHLHIQAAHQGIETVLNELRSTFWVLGARAAVKRAFYTCRWCKLKKVKPTPPEMGSLPTERLTRPSYPFAFTGVDFFGPYLVSIMRKHVKRYGVLFTCLSTRAIHLEVAPDLTTDGTINAIRRFISRRTVPEILWSDNGTNFRGADKELQKAIKEIDRDQVMRTFAGKGMTWKFIPPASPHMGGAWERLVKSVKVALNATLKEVTPKEDVLHTIFVEAEYIVNNRPLTHVSVDPDDPQVLTPNHFLKISKVFTNIPGKFVGDVDLRSQWKLVQEMTERLWSRWVKEYLPTLTRRTKWYQHAAPIKEGDVVVVADKDGPRNSWPLGRILKVYPGKDGQVRVVDVQTKDGVYKRPATKICVLDVGRDDEQKPLSSGGRTVEATIENVTEQERGAKSGEE